MYEFQFVPTNTPLLMRMMMCTAGKISVICAQMITMKEFKQLLVPASMHAVGHIAANLSFAAVAISLTHTVTALHRCSVSITSHSNRLITCSQNLRGHGRIVSMPVTPKLASKRCQRRMQYLDLLVLHYSVLLVLHYLHLLVPQLVQVCIQPANYATPETSCFPSSLCATEKVDTVCITGEDTGAGLQRGAGEGAAGHRHTRPRCRHSATHHGAP